MKPLLFRILATIFLVLPQLTTGQNQKSLSSYVSVLENQGQEPVSFVNQVLTNHQLILFDDALHLAKEPFDFYQKLIRDEEILQKIDVVFVEVFSIAAQPHIDAYLNSADKDSTLLLPVFQNNFSGYGWRYQTYLDLLATVWELNAELPESEKIKVIGVDQPIYWEGIHTRKDYNLFQKSLVARDYFMYKIISDKMNAFNGSSKAMLLTNTRHAYKHIRNRNKELYWNTGTFLNQWHPGKTYSIRIHNVNLLIESQHDKSGHGSTEGLDRFTYKWVRMDGGLWDTAFKENGNKPVAISLKDNVFGQTPYIGNHMTNVAEGQTMYDAYDAVIFLAPLEELHFSANVSFIFTKAFKDELQRRINLLEEGRIESFLQKNGVTSIDEYIENISIYQPVRKNTLVPPGK